MKNKIKNFVSEFTIDQEEIKKAATEAARKAILKEVNDFFTGYDSPFRKEVRKYLEANQPPVTFQLPEFAEIINKGLTEEIDNLCSEIGIKKYAHTLRQALTNVPVREDGTITITDLGNMLYEKAFMDEYGDKVSLKVEDENYKGYPKVTLSLTEDGEDNEYQFGLCAIDLATVDENPLYHVMSMPHSRNSYSNIRIKNAEGVKIEIPSFAGVGSDSILAVIASLLIHNIPIRRDTDWYEKHHDSEY